MPTALLPQHRQFISLIAFTILFLVSAYVLAQEVVSPTKPTSTHENKNKPQQVEIKAKSEIENTRSDTAAKTVISHEELMRYGDTNINDAMKRVAGVLVVKDQLQLLGMNAGYTQILIDGEPPRGVSINELPMTQIERVEIYRAGNAQFSSQAIAGTINIVLKRIPSTQRNQLKVNFANSYRSTGAVEWLASDKHDKLSYSLSISARDSGGLSSASTAYINEFFDDKNQLIKKFTQQELRDLTAHSFRINPRIQYTSDAGSTITSSSALNANRAKFTQETTNSFLVGSTLPVRKNTQDYRSDSNFGSTNFRLLSTASNFKFDMNTGITLITNMIKNSDKAKNPDGRALLDRDVYSHRKTRAFNHSGKVTVAGNDEHDIVGGWTLSRSIDNSRKEELQVNYLPKSTENSLQTTQAAINNLAFFIQDEWKFRKQSSAYFGLRWEAIKLQGESTTQAKIMHQSSVLSPIVQTLWQLNSDNTDRVRLGLSRNFKAPSEFQLASPIYKSLNNSMIDPNRRGSPALRPESAWSFDAAYEHNSKNELSYTIRGKVRRITDLHQEIISFDADLWWYSLINAGKAISKSIEFDLQFPLKRWIEDSPNIDISFDLNKHWSSASNLPGPDNILSPNTFNSKLSMDFRAKDLPLSLGYNLRYSDSRWQQTSITQRIYNPTPVAIDLYAVWKFNQKTLLRTSIDNLLKRQANNLNEQHYAGSRALSQWRSPEYRKVSLSLEHQF